MLRYLFYLTVLHSRFFKPWKCLLHLLGNHLRINVYRYSQRSIFILFIRFTFLGCLQTALCTHVPQLCVANGVDASFQC